MKNHGQSKKFSTKSCEALRAISPRKCGETDKTWLLGLNVVAMLVSVNMSWPNKVTKKVEIVKVWFFGSNLQKTRQFQSENVVSVLFVFFYSQDTSFFCICYSLGPSVPVDRFRMELYKQYNFLFFFFSFVLFVAWKFLMAFRRNPCLWKVLQFLNFYCIDGALILDLHVVTLRVNVIRLQRVNATNVKHSKT